MSSDHDMADCMGEAIGLEAVHIGNTDNMSPIPVATSPLQPFDLTNIWETYKWGILFIIGLIVMCLLLRRLYIRNSPKMQSHVELLDSKPPEAPVITRPDILSLFPPPPGTSAMNMPYSHDDIFCVLNSGYLAAKADRERELRELLNSGPWRRHSYPVPSASASHVKRVSQDDDNVSVKFGVDRSSDEDTLVPDPDESKKFLKFDQVQHFHDPDLNGIWRRRVMEFGYD